MSAQDRRVRSKLTNGPVLHVVKLCELNYQVVEMVTYALLVSSGRGDEADIRGEEVPQTDQTYIRN